jgi:hypothetical protein
MDLLGLGSVNMAISVYLVARSTEFGDGASDHMFKSETRNTTFVIC